MPSAHSGSGRHGRAFTAYNRRVWRPDRRKVGRRVSSLTIREGLAQGDRAGGLARGGSAEGGDHGGVERRVDVDVVLTVGGDAYDAGSGLVEGGDELVGSFGRSGAQ